MADQRRNFACTGDSEGPYPPIRSRKAIPVASFIRNPAAHGEFDQFTRGDVEAMIPGINTFLADYLK